MPHGTTIGLDFGTSTTILAARTGDGLATVLAIGESTPDMPSVAGYSARSRLVTGERAERLPTGQAVRSVKRHITTERATVEVLRGGRHIEVTVAEIVETILKEAGERAGRAGIDLNNVETLRLGCPAQWDSAQRRMLRDIAANAGLGNASPELIDEPVAAGISWVWNRPEAERADLAGRVLVFDYGGGTLDVAVLDVRPVNGQPAISVLSAVGLAIAGDALDASIAADLSEDWRQLGVDPEFAPNARLARTLVELAAREAKVRLSTRDVHTVRVGDGDGWVLPELTYDRDRLEARFEPLLAQAIGVAEVAVRAAELREPVNEGAARPEIMARDLDQLMAKIDHVVLAGGMSHVPLVARRLAQRFPNAQVAADTSLGSPAFSVASGLSQSRRYDRLNLHRPGFDFVLDLRDSHGKLTSHTLYEAHTPLYAWHEVMSGNQHLGLPLSTADLGIRSTSQGSIRVVALDGSDIPLRVGDEPMGSLPVIVDAHRPAELKLYVDGRVLIRGSDGRVQLLRVAQWPVLQTAGDRTLDLEVIGAEREAFTPMAVHSPDWRDARER